jgi:hypothetical protein
VLARTSPEASWLLDAIGLMLLRAPTLPSGDSPRRAAS